MRIINEIIVHCTANRAGTDIGVREIRCFHQEEKGWRDIGYHYVVRLDGTVERGRPISQPGAHCYGRNAHSIGVAYVGGLDKEGKPCDTRTPAQKAALLKLIFNLCKMYHASVSGHNDYARKACPCFDARKEYSKISAQAKTPG